MLEPRQNDATISFFHAKKKAFHAEPRAIYKTCCYPPFQPKGDCIDLAYMTFCLTKGNGVGGMTNANQPAMA